MIKVQLPQWWTETDKPVFGLTDGVTTYCCSSEPCFYVDVPEFEYQGYFGIRDLKVVDNG